LTSRVLVAEPSRTLAALIRATLSEAGYDVEVAPDGATAMASARARHPDALIVDLGLPGLDGYALAHAIRHLRGERVPTLLLASDHAALDPERLAYVGVDEVLAKPFERTVLLGRLQGLLPRPRVPYRPVTGGALGPDGARSLGALGPDGTRSLGAGLTTPFGPPPAMTLTGFASEADPWTLPGGSGEDPEARLRGLVGDAVARLLPAAVSAQVETALGPIVREQLDVLTRERLGATFERTVRAAIGELADPARLDAIARGLVTERLEDVSRTLGAELRGRLEQHLTRELDAFIRNELQKKLERQAEQIIWKTVPALAEELVREEIRRLTEP
jgi:CheY-like chemotaxis protein